jgi:hypothetical protein
MYMCGRKTYTCQTTCFVTGSMVFVYPLCSRRELAISVDRLSEMSSNYHAKSIGVSRWVQQVIFPGRRIYWTTELFRQFNTVVIWTATVQTHILIITETSRLNRLAFAIRTQHEIFGAITAVLKTNQVFRLVTLYRPVKSNRRFGFQLLDQATHRFWGGS